MDSTTGHSRARNEEFLLSEVSLLQMGLKSPFCCWESLPLPASTNFLTLRSFQPELSQALDLYLQTPGTLWNKLGGGEPWRRGENRSSLQTS